MPSRVTMVLGRAEVSRELPSFSVMEIMPVSAMAKLAPVKPTSAWMYFWRITRRATMVRSSGIVRGRIAEFALEQLADFAPPQVHGGKNNVIRRSRGEAAR